MLKYSVLILMMAAQVVMAEEQASYFDKAHKVADNIWIGPQPSEQDFSQFAVKEIGTIINTRTETEMKQLDYNEVDQASNFNMAYELLEIGTGHGYSPAKLNEFNDLMTANAGKNMLLHCRSGHRVTQLYTAWLIKYQDKSPAEALEAIGSDEAELNDSVKTLLGL